MSNSDGYWECQKSLLSVIIIIVNTYMKSFKFHKFCGDMYCYVHFPEKEVEA
jgi:hypothetical protein